MANTYYTLLTQAGQASIANAIALGQQVTLTHMAVGDGNGAPTVPKETRTELVNEVYRTAINQLLTDTGQSQLPDCRNDRPHQCGRLVRA